MVNEEEKHLFVWRESIKSNNSNFKTPKSLIKFYNSFDNSSPKYTICPYCDFKNKWSYYETSNIDAFGNFVKKSKFKCALCGWEYVELEELLEKESYKDIELMGKSSIYFPSSLQYPGYIIGEKRVNYRELLQFSINDANIGLSELGSYLKNNYSDIYNISSKRFEDLISDLYSTIGYEVIMTKRTRDKGADLILMEDHKKKPIIVECKRYSSKRSVGIGHVQRLVGAKISYKAREAILVTSSYFSKPAINEAFHYEEIHHKVNLIDAYDLCKLLQVYNKSLPPIDKINLNELYKENIEKRKKQL